MRPSFQILVSLLVLGMAGVGFWLGVTGYIDGAVEFPSKHQSFLVLRSSSPKMFWACVGVWIAMGFGFAILAVANFREALGRA